MAKKGVKYELVENKMGTGEKKYYARTYVNGTYDLAMLVDRMEAKGNNSAAECHGFFKDLSDSAREILSEGNSINIPRLIKISPVVKGTFDSLDDGYQEGIHHLDINATIAKGFIKKVENKIVVSKIVRSTDKAEVTVIENTRTGENELCKHFINNVMGKFFIFPGYKFSGIEIYNFSNYDERFFIDLENLSLTNFSYSGFSFTILYSLELPAWLVDGLDIFFTLHYETEDEDKKKLPYDSEGFKTRWKEL